MKLPERRSRLQEWSLMALGFSAAATDTGNAQLRTADNLNFSIQLNCHSRVKSKFEAHKDKENLLPQNKNIRAPEATPGCWESSLVLKTVAITQRLRGQHSCIPSYLSFNILAVSVVKVHECQREGEIGIPCYMFLCLCNNSSAWHLWRVKCYTFSRWDGVRKYNTPLT